MTLSPLLNAIIFVISTLFALYITIALIRFLLQLVRADFYNPISQFIVKITNPVLLPLRKIIPGFMGIDFASVVLVLSLEYIQAIIIFALQGRLGTSEAFFAALLFMSVANLVSLAIKIFYFAILIQVILSWTAPHVHNPIMTMIYQLTDPLMRRVRRLIPPIGGFDLSPIFAFMFLSVLDMTIVEYMKIFAASIAR